MFFFPRSLLSRLYLLLHELRMQQLEFSIYKRLRLVVTSVAKWQMMNGAGEWELAKRNTVRTSTQYMCKHFRMNDCLLSSATASETFLLVHPFLPQTPFSNASWFLSPFFTLLPQLFFNEILFSSWRTCPGPAPGFRSVIKRCSICFPSSDRRYDATSIRTSPSYEFRSRSFN